MPFGAQFVGKGAVRFKLWAPAASEVRLDLTHARGRVATSMPASGEGWYALTLEGVEHGARYSFWIDDRIMESADLMYHLTVLMQARGFSWDDVAAVLRERHK